MNFYLQDVLTQPQELRQALSYYQSGEVTGKLDEIAGLKPERVIFSGMGSSHFCALAPSLFLKQHGIPSEVISAGELLHYESPVLNERTLLVLISQSGESAEIVHMIERLPKEIKVIAITNQPGSTLDRRGNYSFYIHVSPEKSVTTRTYLGSAVLVQLVAQALCGLTREGLWEEFKRITGCMEDYLKDYEAQMDRLKSFAGGMQYLCIIGRGYALETVQAGALFLREVLRFPALDLDSAEFRHGPMEMVQQDFHGIVLAAAGATQELNIKLAADIADKEGRVILVTDEKCPAEELNKRDNVLVVRLPETEEWLAPFLQILPIQLLANTLAQERKIPVGEFRWGSKVMRIE